MPPEEIDSLADDVKPLVLKLLRQISGLTARVDELVAQNRGLLVRIAELEAEHDKPSKTPDTCGRRCGCRIACRRSAHTPRRTSSASPI
jgi:hypothetical protein